MMFKIMDFPTTLLLGFGIMFSLSFVMTYLTYQDTDTFFIFLTIFSGYVVWGGMLDMWVLILNIVVLTLIIGNKIYGKERDY